LKPWRRLYPWGGTLPRLGQWGRVLLTFDENNYITICYPGEPGSGSIRRNPKSQQKSVELWARRGRSMAFLLGV
jgi:hypothetical protein